MLSYSRRRHAVLLEDVLIIFLKYPQPGSVKTRLAKEIGDEKAAALYRFFAEAVLARTEDERISRTIFYYPPHEKDRIASWIGREFDMRPQMGEDLGERLSNAFRVSFEKGAKRVVAIGSDSPMLDKQVVLDAFERLKDAQCAIGPSIDGGYYLIGLSVFQPEIFQGIGWGTNMVFGETAATLKRLQLSCYALAESFDIDSYEDLLLFEKRAKGTSEPDLFGLKPILDLLPVAIGI